MEAPTLDVGNVRHPLRQSAPAQPVLFAVSLAGGIEGSGDVAVGNVFGSNVTNAALVLGIAAVIA